MSKSCINCGAELPDEASFCPVCETVQIEKTEVEMPQKHKTRRIVLIAAAAVILLAAVVCVLVSRAAQPKTYTGEATVSYQDFEILASFNYPFTEGQAEKQTLSSVGNDYATLSHIAAFRNGEPDNAAFAPLVDSVSVEVEPEEGCDAMTPEGALEMENFGISFRTCPVHFRVGCGTNELRWTLRMKNGDTVTVTQHITVQEQKIHSYNPDDTPMETPEELNALMEKINAEVGADDIVEIYLPAAVYDQPITLCARSTRLYCGNGGDTVFTSPLAVPEGGLNCEIWNAQLTGSVDSIGVTARKSVQFYSCMISGWKIGAMAENGGWISAVESVFDGNSVGIMLNTDNTKLINPVYRGSTFSNNRIGLQIQNLPTCDAFSFPGTQFIANTMDIDSAIEHPMDFTDAFFD